VSEATAKFSDFYLKMLDSQYSSSIKRPAGLSRLKTALNNADNIAAVALSLGRENFEQYPVFQLRARHPIVQKLYFKAMEQQRMMSGER